MIDAYNEERVLKYNERQFKKIAKIMIYMKLVKYLFYILMLLGVTGVLYGPHDGGCRGVL